jgi:hypothetical protein
LRDLQRRCLNFSLEVHARNAPRTWSERLAHGGLRTSGEEFAAFVAARKESGELEEAFAEEFLEKGRATWRGPRARNRRAPRDPGAPLHRELQAAA